MSLGTAGARAVSYNRYGGSCRVDAMTFACELEWKLRLTLRRELGLELKLEAAKMSELLRNASVQGGIRCC